MKQLERPMVLARKTKLFFLIVCISLVFGSANTMVLAENLVTDASFESSLPLRAKTIGAIYYAEKIKVWEDGTAVGAHEGSYILNFRCWDSTPYTVALKQPFVILTNTTSFSIWLRARATASVSVEFGLYDAAGTTKLMDLATQVHTGNNTWIQVQAVGLTTLTQAMNTNVRLGFKVTAPSSGCEVDLDQAGVFPLKNNHYSNQQC